MAYTTIDDPSAYFQTVLYTGNGSDDRSITNSANAGNFKPDFLWVKERSSTSGHILVDSSRGANNFIQTHNTTAEDTNADIIQAFETNGFQIGTHGAINEDTETYVAWQWKANGGTTSSVSGTGTSAGSTKAGTYQANTTAGFSICTFTTGADDDGDHRVNHGLGAVPHFVIIKERDGTYGWYVFHKTFSATQTLAMHNSTAVYTWGERTGYGDLTSTYFEVDNDNITRDSKEYVAYVWAEIQGYSKFGNYTGTGNAAGPFIYTGFKPAWVMVKRTSDTQSWVIWDSKRPGYNLTNQSLNADENGVEETGRTFDILSNGFKLRDTNTATNADDDTYIYIAFAEQPFVTSGGVPCTAR